VTSPLGEAQTDSLHSVLEDETTRRSVPGANVDVFIDGVPAWSDAAGVRSLETREPMPPAAPFPIYSITKTFASVSALRLRMQSTLHIDDKIERWLPDLPFANDVSLRQLLAHTAGVFNYSALPDYHADLMARPGEPWSFDEFVEHAARRPLDFAPGTAWAYSNTGYTLVKRILEIAAGQSFAELTQRMVVDPIGLENTFSLERLEQMQDLVPGYSALFSNGEPPPRDVRGVYHPGWCGTGLIASTGPEICRFIEAVFDGTLLDAESLAQMTHLTAVPGVHPPAVRPSYGLGLMADPGGLYGPEFGHGGGPGWNLRASHWPDFRGHRITLSVFCNSDAEDAWEIGHSIARTLARDLR
jgi:D-alanyl-D-alanine carboxypeptidase